MKQKYKAWLAVLGKHMDKAMVVVFVPVLIAGAIWLSNSYYNRQKVTEVEKVDSLIYYRNRVRVLTEQLNEAENKQVGFDSLYRVRPTDAELDSLGARIRADVRKSFTR